MISIIPLTGMGEVAPGADVAALLEAALGAAAYAPAPGDVLVVTQKILSKAEDRFVALEAVTPSVRAFELAEATRKDPRLVELVLQESSAIVRAAPGVLITRHRVGFVAANAGIDRSNLGPGRAACALLPPRDPDGSAQMLAEALGAAFGAPLGVVVSDSFGRPWRQGVVNVAIGASGLPALIDRRGDVDREGRTLEVTQIAFADLLASAAGLAMGEAAEGVPAALVRGCAPSAPHNSAASIVRPLGEDLFR